MQGYTLKYTITENSDVEVVLHEFFDAITCCIHNVYDKLNKEWIERSNISYKSKRQTQPT